jgi:hypothetical protein
LKSRAKRSAVSAVIGGRLVAERLDHAVARGRYNTGSV